MDLEALKKHIAEKGMPKIREGHLEEVYKKLVANPNSGRTLSCWYFFPCFVCCETDEFGEEDCWAVWCDA